MPRASCSVFNCMNSSQLRPELSFFTLPSNSQRRLEWLRLICREELMDVPSSSYRVCEEHFMKQHIIQSLKRKTLKKNTLPALNLPQLPTVRTDNEKKVEKYTQTEEIKIEDIGTQTTLFLSSNSPRKRKLKSELVECEKKLRLNEFKNAQEENEKDIFYTLCDKYLSKGLSHLVKAQTQLKFHSKNNRYDDDYKIFCLNLYYSSLQCYRMLQNTFCLPCPTTLNKLAVPITTTVKDNVDT